jgi:hypothetical protein
VSALDERQERHLARVIRHQRPVQVIGLVLALAGAAYVTWGVAQFDPRGDPTGERAFDRPIAQVGQLLARYRAALNRLPTDTPSEAFLMSELQSQTRVTASVAVVLLRILVGTLVLVSGLFCLTVSVERARLLAMIAALRL